MAETTLAPAPNASAASGLSPPPVAVTPAPPRNLDELMLAMDVVDTLRHQDTLVARELNESEREAELLARLRQIYRGQGIAGAGPGAAGGRRGAQGKPLRLHPAARRASARRSPSSGSAAAGSARGCSRRWPRSASGTGAYYVGVVQPAERRAIEQQAAAERARIDLAERLPAALERAQEDALNEAKVPAARTRAEQLAADGRAALNRRDAAGVQQAITDLETLRADLRRQYALRIVSRPNEPSGVFRVPERNRNARNYYLIVEPVTPDGQVHQPAGDERGERAHGDRVQVGRARERERCSSRSAATRATTASCSATGSARSAAASST